MSRANRSAQKPRSFKRTDRVSDVVHRVFAKILREEFKDPRVGMITVSSVVISPDLRQAKVYVTVLQDAKVAETLKVLNKAAGFFRSQLARMMPQLRVVPNPHFIFDESVIRGHRMSTLLEACLGVSSS